MQFCATRYTALHIDPALHCRWPSSAGVARAVFVDADAAATATPRTLCLTAMADGKTVRLSNSEPAAAVLLQYADLSDLESIVLQPGAVLEFVNDSAIHDPHVAPFAVSASESPLNLVLSDATVLYLPVLRRNLRIHCSGRCRVVGRADLAALEYVPAFERIRESTALSDGGNVTALETSGLLKMPTLRMVPSPQPEHNNNSTDSMAVMSSSSTDAAAAAIASPLPQSNIRLRPDGSMLIRRRLNGPLVGVVAAQQQAADPYGALVARLQQQVAAVHRLYRIKGLLRNEHTGPGFRARLMADECCRDAVAKVAAQYEYGALRADLLLSEAVSKVPSTLSMGAEASKHYGRLGELCGSDAAAAMCCVCQQAAAVLAICTTCIEARACECCLDSMVLDHDQTRCPLCAKSMPEPCQWLQQ